MTRKSCLNHESKMSKQSEPELGCQSKSAQRVFKLSCAQKLNLKFEIPVADSDRWLLQSTLKLMLWSIVNRQNEV